MIACAIPKILRDYFDRIYWPRQLGKSPRTATLYGFAIDAFGRSLERPARLDDFDDDSMTAHLASRLAAGLSPFSVSRERDKLLSLWRFAAMKRHVEEWPDVPPIKLPRRQPHAMTRDQIAALLAAARATPGTVGSVPAGVWWRAILTFFLLTGERTEAVLSLRWEWLRDDGWITVPAAVRKGRRKSMSYRLPPHAMNLFAGWPRPPGGKIFAMTCCIGTFYFRYSRLLRRAGLPDDRRWKPQSLRRTFASYVKFAGGNATDALAHDSPSTTTRHYLDPTLTHGEQPGFQIAEQFGLI